MLVGSIALRAPGRSARHHALNDLIARSFASVGIPVTKEPIELGYDTLRYDTIVEFNVDSKAEYTA